MHEQEILSITIDHRKPLELKGFTASMLSIENQYKKFLSAEGIGGEDYSLFIHEIKPGSIVINFIKGAVRKLIEDYVLDKFVDLFKDKIETVVEQRIQDDITVQKEDIKELYAIADFISNDFRSNMAIQVHVGDKTTKNFKISGIEANAIRTECLRQLETKEQPIGELISNAVLHWKSAGDESKSLSIDKGIIEEIDSQRKVKLVCDEELKQQMISENDRNPFNMFFIVNVEVKRIASKPIAYFIQKIHGSGQISEV